MDLRLQDYWHGEAKYHVLPVPTPLESEVAFGFVRKKLAIASLSSEQVDKLADIAVFYKLEPAVNDFVQLLDGEEEAAEDHLRSTAALKAVAWLADAPFKSKAESYYQSLLSRADWRVKGLRDDILKTAFAFRSATSVEILRAAVEVKLASPGEGTPTARLEEFLNLDLKVVEKANAYRSQIEHLENQDEKLRALADLYLELVGEATLDLAEWAGLTLAHLAHDAETQSHLVQIFQAKAKEHEREDASLQEELDATRARALRAAIFFGLEQDKEVVFWLVEKGDPGTDLLALRPIWEYPRHEDE